MIMVIIGSTFSQHRYFKCSLFLFWYFLRTAKTIWLVINRTTTIIIKPHCTITLIVVNFYLGRLIGSRL